MDKQSLSEVYDRFAESYDTARDAFNIDDVIAEFQTKLNCEAGSLLDLGCGAGVPLARSFVDKSWHVTGVDFSEKMIALANKQVPEMQTLVSDISEVTFESEKFDAITAIYSLFHIPRAQHPDLFSNIHQWLKPKGKCLFTYATQEYTGSGEFDGYKEFMGEQLFYSHDKPENLVALLESLAFNVDSCDKKTIAGETFLWLTAEK
ncbi:class I SAM-dependent methyltransferase [Pleionea sediminis]|uniref:class I SAM-dependent methyltransferase n=1 Tax=Pleionea sediminis TaxID=2569479 RepID=UPI00118530ED|nr:class I SAM-dependent methyltransferase [Pleionea sediminis]